MSVGANGGDSMKNFEKAVAQIKAEVLEQVMCELRPLLLELAEIAKVKTGNSKPVLPTIQELQAQNQARMDLMGQKMAERIAQRQAQIAQRLKRKN